MKSQKDKLVLEIIRIMPMRLLIFLANRKALKAFAKNFVEYSLKFNLDPVLLFNKKRLNIHYHKVIACAFTWGDTPEGLKYWALLSKELYKNRFK